jgi:hypothetical protein
VDLRSLSLLVSMFGASAALAGYVGMKYAEPTSQPEMQSTSTPSSSLHSPADQQPTTRDVSSQSPTAPAFYSATPGQRSKPESLPASEKNNSQDNRRTANDATTTRSSTIEPIKNSESNTVNALKCNKQACERAYRSFDADDCTYQPANGPRRVCKK